MIVEGFVVVAALGIEPGADGIGGDDAEICAKRGGIFAAESAEGFEIIGEEGKKDVLDAVVADIGGVAVGEAEDASGGGGDDGVSEAQEGFPVRVFGAPEADLEEGEDVGVFRAQIFMSICEDGGILDRQTGAVGLRVNGEV